VPDRKLLNQGFDRLHREIDANKELFLQIKKAYDRYTIHENLFNKPGSGMNNHSGESAVGGASL
jgi:hypothetical protein